MTDEELEEKLSKAFQKAIHCGKIQVTDLDQLLERYIISPANRANLSMIEKVVIRGKHPEILFGSRWN